MSQKHVSTSLESREALLAIRENHLLDERLEMEIAINDKRIKKFLKHQLIYEHLSKALEFLNACKQLGIAKKAEQELKEINEKNPSAIFSLTIGAIMMYCKHFTKTSGPLSGIPLQPNKYFNNKPELLKTHKKIIEMRNKFIAHSGNSEHESILAFLTFSTNGEMSLDAEHMYKYSFDLDEINQFKRLIKHLRYDIDIELEQYRDEFLDSLSKEELSIYLKKASEIQQNRVGRTEK